ncbi:MAG TPA: gliding motility-associated C-terminal domain-containing protein, partial [Bacteroidetes bacterium]|nr:gliding motility-associated C-terminal domain-containing protein [Bacteroidota bacterium]
ACPDYKIDIQPGIDTICLDENSQPITFVPTITNSDGTGTIEWSGNGIDAVTGVFDPKAAGPGTHAIFMRFREVCSADTTFTIEVIERPVAEFSVENETICITDSVVVTFENNNPSNTNYDWDLAGGTRTDISANKFSIKWNSPGSYMLSLKTNNSICEADRVFVPVEVQPELIAPTINCNPTTNSIMISWDKIDCASSYNVFVDNDMVLNTTDTQYNLLDLEPNSTISFTVEAVSECACGNVQTIVTCETEPCPDITLGISGLPEYLCVSDLTNISLELNITGDNSGTITWEGTGIDNSGNINLAGFNPGEYIYTANYNVQKCDYSISDTLNIIPLPYYEVSSIDPLCHGDENGGIIITNNDNYKYYLNGVEMEGSSVHDLTAGTYSITVKDQYGCESSENITLTDPAAMEPVISGPDFINENSSGEYQLTNVDNFNIESINWYFDGGDTICSGSECRSISISIAEDVNICVDIVNDNGCSANDCIEVRFVENVDVDIPNIFTPDGDGLNDKFYIKGDNTVLSIKELKIFDRWGELVFSQNDFPPNDANYGWDGNFRGKQVLPGVYVFYAILEIKDRPDMKFMGDITIVR